MQKLLRGGVAAATLAALVALFYRSLLFSGLILGDYDAFAYFYPLREYAARALEQGRFPLWNPGLFLGAPFFANLQTAVLYPPNALFLWLPTPYAYTAAIGIHVLLAGGGMYLFARHSLGVSRLPGLMAGITFMFSGFISGQVGHVNQLTVSAWLPLLLALFDQAVRRRSLALGIATGLVATMQFLAGHTQEWYFSTAALGLLALWRVVLPLRGEKLEGERALGTPQTPPGTLGAQASRLLDLRAGCPRSQPTPWTRLMGTSQTTPDATSWTRLGGTARWLLPLAYLALVGLVEAGTAAVQVVPTMELSQQSIRGGGMPYWEGASFSLSPTSALYTLLPSYPSQLFSEYVGYVGVIPLVLALVAIVGWAVRPVSVFMMGIAAMGFLLALGKYNPVFPWLYEWIPGFDMFRVPARWLLLYTLGVSGLAGMGAQLVLDLGERRSPGGRGLRLRHFVSALIPALALVAIVGTVGLFYYLASPRPSFQEIEVWGALAALALALVALASLGKRVRYAALVVLAAIALGELWLAGEKTAVRHPIPYEAYAPQRTSTSFILDDAAKRDGPGRVLTFATDRYEVKETPDYKKEYAWIDPDALELFLVDVKRSEALAANIPLEYGLETVDGYDGGILPLKRYADLKSLLLPVPGLPADNQLRFNLTYSPPLRLLDLLNVRYVLGTKIQDAKVDNVYYDRGVSIVLEQGESIRLQRMPDIQTTAIGVISTTEGARDQEDGTAAAQLVVTDVSGASFSLPLRLGTDTGETPEKDAENTPAAHHKPREVPAWAPEEGSSEYYAKIALPTRRRIKEMYVKNVMTGASLRLRAVTFIDDVAAVSAPLVLSDRLDRELFFDMKVYTLRDPLPRAFVVHSSVVREDRAALEGLQSPQQPLDQLAVLSPSPTARTLYRSAPGVFDPAEARVTSYRPEEVAVDVNAAQDGYLMLLDVFFPGWTAEVDGVPAPIERSDYLFRGVFVGEGEHTVVFRYAPHSFRIGLEITLASLGLLSVALLGLGLRRWRGGRRTVV